MLFYINYIDAVKEKGTRKGKNQKYKPHKRNYLKEKSMSFQPLIKNPVHKITPEMKKHRDVPPRFFENKQFLLSKFKILGIEDENNWTQSKGEGIKYEHLLKMDLYNDSDQLPENMVMVDGKPKYQEKEMNWDVYFEAIMKNNADGFISKYNRRHQRENKPVHTPRDHNVEGYNDENIEWDKNIEASSEEKKSKVKFKEISDSERQQIMKKIQSNSTPSKSGFTASNIFVEEKKGNEELKENEIFFNDEMDNHLRLSKENKDLGLKEEPVVDEIGDIDYSKIIKIEDIESNLIENREETKETSEGEEVKNEVVISAEDLERKQIEQVQTKEEVENNEGNTDKNIPSSLSKEDSPPFIPQSVQNSYSESQNSLQISQMQQYLQAQNDIQTQQMIEQLNQEEIKKTIMQNPNAMFQYQQEMMCNEMNQNIKKFSREVETNPFEIILRDNPTSQWLYKDPQGFVRGPFSCFDMYTWHNEGYFNENLELSLDGINFFRLGDLRAVGQRNNSSQTQYSEENSMFSQIPQGQIYGNGEISPNFMQSQPQIQGYPPQNIPMPQYPAGGTPQMGFGSINSEMGQNYAQEYYSQLNLTAERNQCYPPFHDYQ